MVSEMFLTLDVTEPMSSLTVLMLFNVSSASLSTGFIFRSVAARKCGQSICGFFYLNERVYQKENSRKKGYDYQNKTCAEYYCYKLVRLHKISSLNNLINNK